MWKLGLGATAALIVLVGAIILATLGGYVFRWYAAPFVGKLEEREITNTGAFRIQSYEQFYDWQEELDSIKSKLGLYADRELDRRERTECNALNAQYANIVADYNAASRAERTQGQWRAPDLPQTIEHKEITKCGN